MELSDLYVNGDKKQFEVEVEGHTAIIEYTIDSSNKMFLTHTEVPAQLEGKGIGSALVAKVLQYIKDNGYKVVPTCPFIASYIDKHEQWQALLSDGYCM